MEKTTYDALEIARILGQPLDPKKPYPDLVAAVCQTDVLPVDEHHYYFDVLAETDYVYILTTGGITSSAVTPDTSTELTFVDIVTPEYYVKLTALTTAAEKTLARKVATINRSLHAEESYKVLYAIDAAVASGNKFNIGSGYDCFTFERLVSMIDAVEDYSDNYTLITGTTVNKDIKLFDWTANKYTSLAAALKDLNITIIRQMGSVTIDGTATDILGANFAYLVGTSTNVGKPVLFVRKQLSAIDLLGGSILENSEVPERLIFVAPNPIVASGGTTRYLAVGVTGFEEIGVAVLNSYALARFQRS
jgi:hypothetical protein